MAFRPYVSISIGASAVITVSGITRLLRSTSFMLALAVWENENDDLSDGWSGNVKSQTTTTRRPANEPWSLLTV